MSCTTQRMKLAFDGDLDPEKFGDGLNSHEVALAQAIYQNDAQQAAAIAHSASKSIDINKYINAQRWNKPGQLPFLLFATFQDRPAIVKLILDNTWGESNMQGIAFINQQSSGSERTALHMAAERGYRAVVDILLAAGAAVDAATTKGETPLHLAAEKNLVAIAEVLLAAGAAIEATTSEGKTPLHLAAEKNLVAIAKELVAKNAAVDATTSEGKTPLHLAAENNGQEAVSYLLSNQANPQATDHQERTPLALARSVHHEEIVKILAPYESSSKMRQALAGLSHFDSIKNTLEQANYRANKPVNAQGHNLLYHAAEEGWQEVVKLLVETGEEDDLKDAIYQENHSLSPLYIAVEKGNTEIVKLLVYGSAANNHRMVANQEEDIEREAVSDREAIVGKLRDQEGRTLLHVAATKGYERIVRLLVEFMAIAAEQFESSQTTPLYQGHVMRELAYVSQVDAYGTTAESLARNKGFTSIANFLKKVREAIEKKRKNLDKDAAVLSGSGGGVSGGFAGASAGVSLSRTYQTQEWAYKRAGLIIATRKIWRDQNNRLWQNLAGNDAAAPINNQRSRRKRRCCCC